MAGASAGLRAQLDEMFGHLSPLSFRNMFGGTGVYSHGRMFALVADEAVYLKTDPTLAAELEAAGSSPFTYMARDRAVTMGYWRLPDAAFDDPDLAADWAQRALDIATG